MCYNKSDKILLDDGVGIAQAERSTASRLHL